MQIYDLDPGKVCPHNSIPYLDLYIPALSQLPGEHYTPCYHYSCKWSKQPWCHPYLYVRYPFCHWMDAGSCLSVFSAWREPAILRLLVPCPMNWAICINWAITVPHRHVDMSFIIFCHYWMVRTQPQLSRPIFWL